MIENIINIAIFVSGNGTNCENIIRYLEPHATIRVALVVSSRADAYALVRIKPFGIPFEIVDKSRMSSDEFIEQLKSVYHIDFIVLAGFLLRIPDKMIAAFEHRMINIHPSLLPMYGGKGMYGHHIHEAIAENGDMYTGMTVHWVSNEIDGGAIIHQERTQLRHNDTAEDIAAKEHELEMRCFPPLIEQIINTHLRGKLYDIPDDTESELAIEIGDSLRYSAEVYESVGIHVEVEYDTDVFDVATHEVNTLASRFVKGECGSDKIEKTLTFKAKKSGRTKIVIIHDFRGSEDRRVTCNVLIK